MYWMLSILKGALLDANIDQWQRIFPWNLIIQNLFTSRDVWLELSWSRQIGAGKQLSEDEANSSKAPAQITSVGGMGS